MRAPAGIEVGTTGIKVVLAGFSLFPSIINKILVSHGIVKPVPSGEVRVEDNQWVPLDQWLSMLEAVEREIGPNALYSAARHILTNPRFPAWGVDINTALESMDIAFHRSHRKNGTVMYDESTGAMLEGIGHYRVHHTARDRVIRVVCDTPYPCESERGIVAAVAEKFERKARTVHADGPCRRNGGLSCTYVVTW